MISMTRSIRHFVVFVICLGFFLKYQELRLNNKRVKQGGKKLDVVEAFRQLTDTDDDDDGDGGDDDTSPGYQTQSNLTFMAKLTEKFPPRIRDYFLDSERPFLRMDGKQRFMEYLNRSYPNQSESFRHQMRRINETWHQRLPSAIIIGCKKCGTTFLKDALIRHPFVAMAETENGHFIMREKYEQGWPFYRSEMAYSFPDQITMEKSPLYWPVSQAPKRIYDYNPDVKLILVVRDPACRIASDFFFGQNVVGYVPANITFKEAIMDPKNSEVRKFLGGPSKYGPIMRQWLEYFPLENFKIIRNEDMLSMQVKDVFADLEDFLGIPHGVNVARGQGREICIKQPIESRNFCFNATKPEDMPCKYYGQYPEIMSDLRDEYMPFADDFAKTVGRDFGW